MSLTIPLVFLSSTSEFDAARIDIQSSLQSDDYKVWYWKDERARDVSAEEHCRSMIAKADVVVFLLGNTYGTNYDARRSICEWEFETAVELREPELMPFVKDTASTEADPRQRTFIARVSGDFRSGRWCKPFHDTRQLVSAVTDSIRQWRYEFYSKVKKASGARNGKTFLWIGVALALMAAVFGATLTMWALTRSEILTATMTIASAALGVFALMRRETQT